MQCGLQEECWRSAEYRSTSISANNRIEAPGSESLAGVLEQCTELAHLNLCGNLIGDSGAESLAGVLPQYATLANLNLFYNQIGEAGTESLAGVLAQYPELNHLDLSINGIEDVGKGRLRVSWRGQASGLRLLVP